MNKREITPQVLDLAIVMTRRHAISSLDAIQLASAIMVRDLLPGLAVRFITSDRGLLAAADGEDFLIWDPSADFYDR